VTLKLTDSEKEYLDGKRGRAQQKAMDLLVRYGDALLKEGKRSEAANQYARALSLDPKNEAARARLQNR